MGAGDLMLGSQGGPKGEVEVSLVCPYRRMLRKPDALTWSDQPSVRHNETLETIVDEYGKQMRDHRSNTLNLNSWEKKPEKNSALNEIRTHDRCYTGAVLLPTELSSQLGAGHFVNIWHVFTLHFFF